MYLIYVPSPPSHLMKGQDVKAVSVERGEGIRNSNPLNQFEIWIAWDDDEISGSDWSDSGETNFQEKFDHSHLSLHCNYGPRQSVGYF